MNNIKHFVFTCALTFITSSFACAQQESEFRPDQSSLPVAPPKTAIMLFDGDQKLEFVSMKGEAVDWPIEDGAIVSTRGKANTNHMCSAWHFRDADIHVEFMLPKKGSGNSGIYIHGNYELQIINSHAKKKLNQNDMGAVYGFAKPITNAALPPQQWQVYDIRYRAPRRDANEKIIEEGSITAWLNGKKVQDNTRFGEPRSVYHPYRHGTTPYLQAIWKQQKKTMVGPVFLQDHNNAVKFRNVWIVPRDELAKRYEPSGS